MTLRPIEDVHKDVGSISDVLERHGFNSARGRTLCPNPAHEDRRPGSVSILPETGSGPERIVCHACGWHENAIGLARLLGEHVRFTEPSEPKSFPRRRINWHPIRTRKQTVKRTRLVQELADDPTIEKDWMVAKKLVELGNKRAVQREIVRNYDYLSENYNLPRVWELVQGIWDWGSRVHGLPDNDPKSRKRWVGKVAKGLEAS